MGWYREGAKCKGRRRDSVSESGSGNGIASVGGSGLLVLTDMAGVGGRMVGAVVGVVVGAGGVVVDVGGVVW